MPKYECKNNPDKFCYACGLYISSKTRISITDALQTAYLNYFGFAVVHQDKKWVPHILCNKCRVTLQAWAAGAQRQLSFGVPILWREPTNHETDCYFCLTQFGGVKGRRKLIVNYADVPHVTKPVPHSDSLPVPICPDSDIKKRKRVSDDSNTSALSSGIEFTPTKQPRLLSQAQLIDWIRDLKLSKIDAQLHASRMKEFNFLAPGVKVTIYRNHGSRFAQYYAKDGGICYCKDMNGLFTEFGQSYDPTEWRLFIDGCKYSLKAVLLHIGNKKPSIPVAHAVDMKESCLYC